MSLNIPKSFHVSGSSLVESSEPEDEVKADPRGLVHVWEPPMQHAKYVMGCDPTMGITGWGRGSRTTNDHKVDNGVIEIFRIDAIRVPYMKDGRIELDEYTKQPKFYFQDLQVAEFAAPIDAVEIARVCNLLGRIYCGSDQDQCELIYEAYPGPGVLTTQELLRLGYTNLWQWEYIDSAAESTNRIGWRSNRETQKLLWFRSRRHILEDRCYIQSPWLLEEYGNAVIDPDTMRAKAAYGYHDDRIQAANMAMWAGHKWAYDVERTWEPVTEKPQFELQSYAPVLGEERMSRDRWGDFLDEW
jgi:hypothetical protein